MQEDINFEFYKVNHIPPPNINHQKGRIAGKVFNFYLNKSVKGIQKIGNCIVKVFDLDGRYNYMITYKKWKEEQLKEEEEREDNQMRDNRELRKKMPRLKYIKKMENYRVIEILDKIQKIFDKHTDIIPSKKNNTQFISKKGYFICKGSYDIPFELITPRGRYYLLESIEKNMTFKEVELMWKEFVDTFNLTFVTSHNWEEYETKIYKINNIKEIN